MHTSVWITVITIILFDVLVKFNNGDYYDTIAEVRVNLDNNQSLTEEQRNTVYDIINHNVRIKASTFANYVNERYTCLTCRYTHPLKKHYLLHRCRR
jgi:hypothetical protein